MGIEAALLGTAGVGVGAGAAGAVLPATAGLIGSGGALTLGGVGSLFSGLSAASSLFGGVSAQKESNKQANIAQAQANLQAEETARAGAREASFVGMEAESVRRRQKLAYLKSGVDLEGSPLLVMEATRKAGLDNVEEVYKGNAAGAQVVEGRTRAASIRSSGRQAFMQGIGNATSALSRIG